MTDDLKPPTEEELRQAEDRARAYPAGLPKWVVYEKWHAQRLDDTRRLVAEVKRLRAIIKRVARNAMEYHVGDDAGECCFCGGDEHEPTHHTDDCVMLDVYRVDQGRS